MGEDYSKEVKKLIKQYQEEIIFGKGIDFLIKRIKMSKEESDILPKP